jgi:hypothetical protein
MNSQTWIKLCDNEQRTVFAKVKGHGLVTIEKIPEVDVHTIEVTGYTYSVKSSKKYTKFQSFRRYEKALEAAEKRMEQFN